MTQKIVYTFVCVFANGVESVTKSFWTTLESIQGWLRVNRNARQINNFRFETGDGKSLVVYKITPLNRED